MSTSIIVLIIIAAILAALITVLYFLGKRMQKKQEEQNEQVQRYAQPVSLLVIDKQKVNIKKSGLPDAVIAQTPFYLRRSKVPIVKGKVGSRIVTFVCDAEIFNDLPTKKEIRAMVSGIYISGFKELHGKSYTAPKKKGLMQKLRRYASQGSMS